MAHYLFNFVRTGTAEVPALRQEATRFLRAGMWGIDAAERHSDALAPGDVALVYLGAPAREFVGRAEIASAVQKWTAAEGRVYPGDSRTGVLLTRVEECDPPAPMSAVLSQIDPAEKANADFDAGLVRITAHEYETAVAVAAGLSAATD